MRREIVGILCTLVLLVSLGLAIAVPMGTPALAAHPSIYEYYSTGDDAAASIYGNTWDTQTFTPSVAHTITSVKLKLYKTGTGPGTITVGIRATDGSGLPTGSDLCSGTTDGNTLPAATSQTRLPTGDQGYSGTWDKTTDMYSYVDDDPWNDGDTTYLLHGTTAGYALFTFSPFDVPEGTIITSLQVTYSCRRTSYGTSNLRAALRVGGTDYLTTDSGANPDLSYADRTYTYSTNPATSSPWTVDDINGTGSNQLQAFGVSSNDASPAIRITAVKAVVNYVIPEWREITLGSGYSLSAGTTYAIVVRAPGGDTNNRGRWTYDSPGSYDGGILLQSRDGGSSWNSYSNLDFMFEEWGNAAPVADSQSGLTVNSCSTLTVTLTGNDPENDPLTYIISTLPLHGDLYDGTGTGGTHITSVPYTVTDATHKVTYQPNTSYSGTDSFGFKVNDGAIDSAEATISITVSAGCTTYYKDADADTYGITGDTQCLCAPTGQYTATQGGDCDDNDASVNPGATEVPYNDKDDDCNPATLDDDLDEDGYPIATDCDDTDPDVNPGATEVCNGIDDDCDTLIDEGVTTTYYRDYDSDTYGDPSVTTEACEQPEGYVLNNTDCDDTDPDVNPGATEVPYNDKDDDCNPATLDDDLDQDTYGIATDCDDNDVSVNPGATEVPYNGKDDDCNPATPDAVYDLTMATDPEAGGTATDLTNESPYEEGTKVSIRAEANEGYEFVNWTAPAGVFGNATAAETIFTMPAQNVTITANFEEVPTPVYPTVTTQAATTITTNSTTLNMNYTMGDFSPVDVRFAYKKSANTEWSYTDWVSKSESGTYAEVLTGLNASTKYNFKAQLKYNDTEIEGDSLQFTTKTSSTLPPSEGCFIATAAYGTPTAEQINVLREFRDVVLLKNTVGSQFVALYYQFSPPIADFIAGNSFLRTLVRELVVDPIVWVVEATGDIWQD